MSLGKILGLMMLLIALASSSVGASAHVGEVRPLLVDGAHLRVTSMWNATETRTAEYQAPAGYVIISAEPVVTSESQASYRVVVSADRRTARLDAAARGSGKWYDQRRGWFDGLLRLRLEPAVR